MPIKFKTALIAGALICLGILETRERIYEEMSVIEIKERNSEEVSGWDYDFEEEVSEDRLFDDEPSYPYQ